MRAQANLLLGMVRGALQGQVWRSMFAWVAEPRRRWREDARARVGLDGPHHLPGQNPQYAPAFTPAPVIVRSAD